MQPMHCWEGKFIALNAYIRKEDRSQISNINSYINELKREEQSKLKAREGSGKSKDKSRSQWNRKQKKILKINKIKNRRNKDAFNM